MTWSDSDRWLQLKQGVGCPMCEDIYLPENQHSFLVWQTDHTIVRLPKNQVLRGWTIVFAKRHVAELYEFSNEELCSFWQIVAQVGKALDIIYKPPKINYCVYGNQIPHVHCHIIPQNHAQEPQMLTVIESETVFLADTEYRDIIAQISAHIM